MRDMESILNSEREKVGFELSSNLNSEREKVGFELSSNSSSSFITWLLRITPIICKPEHQEAYSF